MPILLALILPGLCASGLLGSTSLRSMIGMGVMLALGGGLGGVGKLMYLEAGLPVALGAEGSGRHIQ